MSEPSLAIHTYNRATVYPVQSLGSEPNILRLGVFTEDGQIVESTVTDRHHGSHLYKPAEPAESDTPVESPHPDAIYGGVFFNHYGHFLLESTARLWAASTHPDVPIVWIGADRWPAEPALRSWQRDILDVLGVSNPTRILIKPEGFNVVHVPDPGWRYADWSHPDHVKFLAAYEGPRQDDARKLWLSRGLAHNGVGLRNSNIAERWLEANGWRILHPELLPIREQLDALAEARVIAGEEGSALHSLLLLKDVSRKEVHVFRRHGPEHRSFRTIGDARQLNQAFHSNSHDAVISAVGREVHRIAPNAAEILNHLRVPVRQPRREELTMAQNHSTRRLHGLAQITGAQSYLEVGVFDGATFNNVDIADKDAVDLKFRFDVRAFATPNARFYEVTSDDFFLHFHNSKKYDLIFLDGLHTFEQTFRDFCASQSAAHDRTVWLIDDIFPLDIYSAHPDQATALKFRHATGNERKAWHGDVYKVVFAINDFFPNISFRAIKTGGNHQLVAWKAPRDDFKPRFNNLEQITRLTYYDLHDNLDVYRFGTEDEVLATVAEWAGQWQAGMSSPDAASAIDHQVAPPVELSAANGDGAASVAEASAMR